MDHAQLKIGENDNLKNFVENYSYYKTDYQSYCFYKDSLRNIFILLYLFIPAASKHFFPNFEEIILIVCLVLLSFLWSSMSHLSEFIIKFILKKINYPMFLRVLMYAQHHKHLKESIEETLSKGTSTYLEDVVINLKKSI